MPSVRQGGQAKARVYTPVAVKPIQARTVCNENEKLNNNKRHYYIQEQGISLGLKNDVVFAMG